MSVPFRLNRESDLLPIRGLQRDGRRADDKLSAKDSLFVTYARDPSFYLNPIAFNESKSKTSAYRQAIIVEETHLVSAPFANTVRVALNRTNGITNHFDDESQTINPAANDPSLAMFQGSNYYRAPATNLSGTGITMQPGGLHALTQQDIWSRSSRCTTTLF